MGSCGLEKNPYQETARSGNHYFTKRFRFRSVFNVFILLYFVLAKFLDVSEAASRPTITGSDSANQR